VYYGPGDRFYDQGAGYDQGDQGDQGAGSDQGRPYDDGLGARRLVTTDALTEETIDQIAVGRAVVGDGSDVTGMVTASVPGGWW
jgi:hypothetical protein